MFARLVGEGFEKPDGDADVPVDIHYAKVVEWVVCFIVVLLVIVVIPR